MNMSQAFLQIRSPQGVRRIELGDKPLTIGRHAENALVLSDLQASRRHCVIERAGPGWRLRDLGSSNGTLVNGRRVHEVALENGDVIRIGQVEIAFHDGKSATTHAALEESEPIEELTEADLLTVEPSAPTLPSGAQLNIGTGETEQVLEELAESLPERKFGEHEIALLNARDQVAHPRSTPRRRGVRRETLELFRLLLLVCFRSRATDIHLEPKSGDWQLRVRIDGNMVDLSRPNQQLGARISAMVKVLCDIDPTRKDLVQEGHFAATVPDPKASTPDGRRVDYRVSFVPSVFGQKMVIRVLDTANAPDRIHTLGLSPSMLRAVQETLENESGMLLVCGPTGSGKTTTLYALVRSIDLRERNVVTIEDPVETQIEGVTQLPVDEEHGKTFSSLLRSVLRQDPDAILVGEIRDTETARIAMQAAITGHLVFSTVHTRDTAGTIFRLLDLGVEPYMVAQGLHVVLGQRLARRLCPACKRPSKITPQQRERMGKAGENIEEIYVPLGCPRCLGTGYLGRQGFFELLVVNDALREVILRSPTPQDIRQVLDDSGFVRLADTGFELVAKGLTSFEEIDRAVGRDTRIIPT